MANRKPKPPKVTPSIVPLAGLAQLDMFRAELLRRNPYMLAEHLFVAGNLLQGQAVALMLTDGDYIGECLYAGKDARLHAECIVRDQWSRALVAGIQANKAIERCANASV